MSHKFSKTGLTALYFVLCCTLSLTSQNTANLRSVQPEIDCSAIQTNTRSESLHQIPQVIAHRGYWNTPGASQNSITAIQNAQKLGVYGAEIDLWITSDGVVILNHDATIGKDTVQNIRYEQLKEITLSNGEKLPTLESALTQANTNRDTKLIIEIKTHNSFKKHQAVVKATVDAVEKAGLSDNVEYIAFSLEVCKELLRYEPQAIVAYLNGDASPQSLHELGIKGIDYHISALRKNPTWIQEAHKLGMSVNVWTVNTIPDMIEMMNAGVDFITTDNPAEAKLVQRCYWD